MNRTSWQHQWQRGNWITSKPSVLFPMREEVWWYSVISGLNQIDGKWPILPKRSERQFIKWGFQSQSNGADDVLHTVQVECETQRCASAPLCFLVAHSFSVSSLKHWKQNINSNLFGISLRSVTPLHLKENSVTFHLPFSQTLSNKRFGFFFFIWFKYGVLLRRLISETIYTMQQRWKVESRYLQWNLCVFFSRNSNM